ncbi:MAG: hypothetical protein ABH827_03050 [bacterium]
MKKKTEITLSRITLDVPEETHKKLKMMAAILGKSMRDIIIEAIEEHLHGVNSPNKDVIRAIKVATKDKS